MYSSSTVHAILLLFPLLKEPFIFKLVKICSTQKTEIVEVTIPLT